MTRFQVVLLLRTLVRQWDGTRWWMRKYLCWRHMSIDGLIQFLYCRQRQHRCVLVIHPEILILNYGWSDYCDDNHSSSCHNRARGNCAWWAKVAFTPYSLWPVTDWVMLVETQATLLAKARTREEFDQALTRIINERTRRMTPSAGSLTAFIHLITAVGATSDSNICPFLLKSIHCLCSLSFSRLKNFESATRKSLSVAELFLKLAGEMAIHHTPRNSSICSVSVCRQMNSIKHIYDGACLSPSSDVFRRYILRTQRWEHSCVV